MSFGDEDAEKNSCWKELLAGSSGTDELIRERKALALAGSVETIRTYIGCEI
jgi:hypothetical protein